MLLKPFRILLIVTLLLCGVSSARAQDLADLLDQVRPSVVTIEAITRDGKSVGTGFVAREDGVILTAAHVVEDARKIRVRFADGRTVEVEKVLQADDDLDYAILQIAPGAYKSLPLGDSDRIRQGERVISLGSPLGVFDFTASEGIISALRNSKMRAVIPNVPPIYIQTTAAISQGNSGGPLFNLRGEVIGIAVFKAKDGENLNFALAINQVKPALGRIGKLTRPTVATGPDRSVTASKAPGSPVPIRPKTSGNENWFLIASQGADSGQVYRPFDVLDPLDSKEVKTWVEAKWEQGYQITEIAPGDNQWVIMMTKNASYSNSNILSAAEFPQKRVEELRKENRFITGVHYGLGRWMLIISEYPEEQLEKMDQVYRVAATFPTTWVREKMAAGYRITSVDNDRQEWVVVMTRGTDLGEQVFRLYKWGQLPDSWIKENRANGYYITLTGGGPSPNSDPMGIIVMTQGVGYTNQAYWFGKEFPQTWIREKWDDGWDITVIR